jgi:hypothetical protein
MLERVLRFSIEQRFLILLLTLVLAGLGVYSMQRLPIDAVPDITNKQVQINTLVPALSPVDIERQVTFPIETALAGISGLEYTRSLSRNGFSQVTAVFRDDVDIYFARQQVNERLSEARESSSLPWPLQTAQLSSRSGRWHDSILPKARTRSAVRTASAASWSRLISAAATWAHSSPRPRSASTPRSACPRQLARLGWAV